MLFSSCGTFPKRMKNHHTQIAAHQYHPQSLNLALMSRGVRACLVPLQPNMSRLSQPKRSSTETPACCSQVAGPNRKHETHHHNKRRINITPKAWGLASRVVWCACTLPRESTQVSSTETPACCSQIAGPNRKHETHHHK